MTDVQVQPSADVDDSAVLGAGTAGRLHGESLGGPCRGPSGGVRFRQVALSADRRSVYGRGRRALDDAGSGMTGPAPARLVRHLRVVC